MERFVSNVVGPALVVKSMLPYIEKGQKKVVLNMTSGLASISSNFGAFSASYSISKTALNMLVWPLSVS